MTGWPTPPPLARWLLERALPADVREAVSGDLDEVFQRDCRTYGPRWARLRYWRTMVSFSRHFVVERWRDQHWGGVMRTGMSWLDVKLGLRMLVRYPGLSLAGGLAIAVVIACGTATAVFDAAVHSTLPFEEGERVVAIENWDTTWNDQEYRALHDFVSWRDELKSVEDIGAYRLIRRNLTVADRQTEPVRVAEITAAAFQVARVPPLLGRHLVAEDEREGAPAVAVIGADEWQRRFSGDPQVVGRTLQLGETTCTVVGVMPESFRFPVNEHFWIPLRLNSSDYERREGPVIHVFGRLAAGADLAAAQAELTTIGQRAALDFPNTHARLQPRVVPYTRSFFDDMEGQKILIFQILVALLLVVVCANVAVLVYARTATRRIEIAVRTALGASRRRIVGQMFVEGLALSAAAAAVGLGIARVALGRVDALMEQIGETPFWMDVSLASETVALYVLMLTVLGAVIVGVIPALQATGRRAQAGLQQAATSLSRWKIGRTYTVLIVVQVALAVAILPAAVSSGWRAIQHAVADPGFPADEFLTARLVMDREVPPSVAAAAADREIDARFRDRQAELARRLESDPGVSEVTFLASLPGNEPRERIEVEGERTDAGSGAAQPGYSGHEVGIGQIDVNFFEVVDVPILAGRQFDSRDLDAASRHVIVNRTFAQKVIGGNAIGRRVRYTGARESSPGPWLEIVGVMGDFPASSMNLSAVEAKLYHPTTRGDAQFVLLALRVRGVAPAVFTSRLREITTALDRSLRLDRIASMDALLREQRFELRMVAWSTGLITLSVLLLSATGLYALMAFSVTQRRPEIGIRVALGASPLRIVSGIISRALWQLATGIVVGVAIAALLDTVTEGEVTGGVGLRMLPAVAGFVLLVGLIAAAGPARRGMRIQPTEALREE
ncbi:MAG: FtsX-like permease family protein [Luteitalea sp.]|nr:FtsX-like permease family protein [Luteitalea sp.]